MQVLQKDAPDWDSTGREDGREWERQTSSHRRHSEPCSLTWPNYSRIPGRSSSVAESAHYSTEQTKQVENREHNGHWVRRLRTGCCGCVLWVLTDSPTIRSHHRRHWLRSWASPINTKVGERRHCHTRVASEVHCTLWDLWRALAAGSGVGQQQWQHHRDRMRAMPGKWHLDRAFCQLTCILIGRIIDQRWRATRVMCSGAPLWWSGVATAIIGGRVARRRLTKRGDNRPPPPPPPQHCAVLWGRKSTSRPTPAPSGDGVSVPPPPCRVFGVLPSV